MTDVREYQKRWRAQHREQVKEREKENARRRALAELANVEKLESGIIVVTDKNGDQFILNDSKTTAKRQQRGEA